MNIIKDFFNIIEYVINTPSRRCKKPYRLNISVNNIDFAKEDSIMVTMTNSQYMVLNIVPINNARKAVSVSGTKPEWKLEENNGMLHLEVNETGLSCKVETCGITGKNKIIVSSLINLKNSYVREIKGEIEIEIIEGEATSFLIGHEEPKEKAED
jgi:hypothetical protein